jgi:hypothetical protein
MGFIFYEVNLYLLKLLHGTTPWVANTEYELIKNLLSKPLKFSVELSPVVKDFLSKCLKV